VIAPVILGYARPDHGRLADAELLARAAQRIRLGRTEPGPALAALADFLDAEADRAEACPGERCEPACDCPDAKRDLTECDWFPAYHPCPLTDPDSAHPTALWLPTHHHCVYCGTREAADPDALVLAAAVLEDGAL
jgi:hypothetical protein